MTTIYTCKCKNVPDGDQDEDNQDDDKGVEGGA